MKQEKPQCPWCGSSDVGLDEQEPNPYPEEEWYWTECADCGLNGPFEATKEKAWESLRLMRALIATGRDARPVFAQRMDQLVQEEKDHKGA